MTARCAFLVVVGFAASAGAQPGPVDDEEQAAALTETARDAARRHQCYALAALGDRVRVLDPDYYERVFSHDPAITGCRLLPPEVPAPACPGTALWLSLGPTLGATALGVTAFAMEGIRKDGGTWRVTASDSTQKQAMWIGVVGGIGLLVGPSIGHTYAGQTGSRGLALRAGGLVAAGLGGIVLFGSETQGDIVIAAGGAAFLAGVIDDVVTAPRVARQYNRFHGLDATATVVPIASRSGMAPGFGMVGRF